MQNLKLSNFNNLNKIKFIDCKLINLKNDFDNFNLNNHQNVSISQLSLNTPINILFEDKYLYCHNLNNIIYFDKEENNSINSQWIIEKDLNNDNIYYIKTCSERKYNDIYLGAPNKNNNVNLYTTKNKYTQWEINNNNIINYIGDKFDIKKIIIIILFKNYLEDDIHWLYPYFDILFIQSEFSLKMENFKNEKNFNSNLQSYSYLKYIKDNYNNLSDKNIFFYDNPFINNPTILYAIDNYEKLNNINELGSNQINNIEKTNYGLEYSLYDFDKNTNLENEKILSILSISKNYINKYNNNVYLELINEYLKICNNDYILERFFLLFYEFIDEKK